MAKKYNQREKNSGNTPHVPPRHIEPADSAPKSRDLPTSPSDGLFKKIFAGVAVLGLLWMIIGSFSVGINADDKFQNDYSTKLVNYYSTMGQDTSALFVKDGNMHLYGGFFEIVTGFANKALGLTPNDGGYHNVRHASSAIMGWIAMLCAALLARLLAGWQAGLFTFLLMLFSPRFFGHSLMNPKDIPFAAGYIMALYNLACVLKAMPNPAKKHLIGLVVGLGIGLATRAGGLLPFAIMFLFTGLYLLWKHGFSALGQGGLLLRYLVVTLGVAVAGYFLAILFWPYAMQAPTKNPFIALSKFSELEVKIRVLFAGRNMMSDLTPNTYPITWIGLTIPLAVLVGFFGFFAFIKGLFRRSEPVLLAMLVCGATFPVLYVVYKNSVIHDGWRHLTFAFPPIAVMAGIFWSELSRFFSEKKPIQYAVIGLMSLLALDAVWYNLANTKLAYTYFNPLAGGTKGAVGHYETDYWGISIRQGIEWMEEQGILKPGMTDTVHIGTNMFYAAEKYLAKYGKNVQLKYVKWDRRCDQPYQYGLYPTRFIDGSTLQKGLWPPDNVVHTVTAGGAPLLAVIENKGNDCYEASEAAKKGDWATAIAGFKAELARVPDNDLAWGNLANALLNNQELEEAKLAAEKALEISPNDSQANNTIGLYFLRKNDTAAAKKQFETALSREPSNPGALYYLALIAQMQQDNGTALKHLEKCINLAPRFMQAYEMMISIYESSGDAARANQVRQYMQQFR